MIHQHQLEAGTYTVFDTPEECRDAFERARQLGFDTYGKYSEGETIVYFDYDKEIVSCIEPNNIEHEFEGYTRFPPTEFLSRMEGTWEQSAENAQSTQPIEKLEQLPISEVKWQLEKERWKFDGLGNYADHSSNMFPIQLYRGRWCIKATIEEEYFKNALSDIQQAIDACQRLNNAKQ